MPNGTSERSALIEHCGVGGSVRKGTLYPILVRRSAQYCTSPYDGASMCQRSVCDA